MDLSQLPKDQQDLIIELNPRVVLPGQEGNAGTRILFGKILVLEILGLESNEDGKWISETPYYYQINSTRVPYTGTVSTVTEALHIEEVHRLVPALLLAWLVNYGAMLFPSLVNVSLHALRVLAQNPEFIEFEGC